MVDKDVIFEKVKQIQNCPSLSGKLQKMVGFRNVAVHDYASIEVSVLKSVLADHLVDLEEFYSRILMHFGLVSK